MRIPFFLLALACCSSSALRPTDAGHDATPKGVPPDATPQGAPPDAACPGLGANIEGHACPYPTQQCPHTFDICNPPVLSSCFCSGEAGSSEWVCGTSCPQYPCPDPATISEGRTCAVPKLSCPFDNHGCIPSNQDLCTCGGSTPGKWDCYVTSCPDGGDAMEPSADAGTG